MPVNLNPPDPRSLLPVAGVQLGITLAVAIAQFMGFMGTGAGATGNHGPATGATFQ